MRLAAMLLLVLAVVGCTTSANQKDNQTVSEQQTVYTTRQPVPRFEFSQDRDTLIQIYRLRNEVRPTYTVVAAMTGQIVFECASRGYAIPADTQLTNPLGPQYGNSGAMVVEQPEPNGLYSSKNTDGTWVLCVRDDGSVNPVYTEQKVTTFPFPVTHEADSSTLHDARQASSSTLTLRNAQGAPPGNAPTAPAPEASPSPTR
jgi:hypothetical protein